MTIKTLNLVSHGPGPDYKTPIMDVTLDTANPGSGSITSYLERLKCPVCGEVDCPEDSEDVANRLKYNGFLDGLESLTLALACAGVNVATPEYIGAIVTAIDAAGNKYY